MCDKIVRTLRCLSSRVTVTGSENLPSFAVISYCFYEVSINQSEICACKESSTICSRNLWQPDLAVHPVNSVRFRSLGIEERQKQDREHNGEPEAQRSALSAQPLKLDGGLPSIRRISPPLRFQDSGLSLCICVGLTRPEPPSPELCSKYQIIGNLRAAIVLPRRHALVGEAEAFLPVQRHWDATERNSWLMISERD